MTGRGFGDCVLPVEELPAGGGRGYGRGFGSGRGRGWGRGRGAGFGWGRGGAVPLLPVEPAADPVLAQLQRLEARLAALEARLPAPPSAQA